MVRGGGGGLVIGEDIPQAIAREKHEGVELGDCEHLERRLGRKRRPACRRTRRHPSGLVGDGGRKGRKEGVLSGKGRHLQGCA